jgi:hypothetical protein
MSQAGRPQTLFGHFKNVQKPKGPPDLYQKSGFSDLEHNAANCVFSKILLLP